MKKKLLICINRRLTPTTPSCAQRNSESLAAELVQRIASEQLAIEVETVFCLGRCQEGPVVKLVPGGAFLTGMELEAIMEKVREFAAPTAQQI